MSADADRASNRRTLLGIAILLILSCGLVVLLRAHPKAGTVTVILRPPAGGEEQVSAKAVYDPASGLVRIVLKDSRPPAGKDYQLWMYDGRGAAKSLGVVSGLDLVEGSAPGATGFLISLEPKGGAQPEGGPPTGPVVASGKMEP